MHNPQIPIIHFDRFSIGDTATQQQIAHQIQQACREFGFFYLTGFELSQRQIQQAFTEAAAFFALPVAVKTQVQRSTETNCGYVPICGERLNPSRAGDLKEAFNVGLDAVWPTDLPQFRSVIESFYRACIAQVAEPLLQALALSLDLPIRFFNDRHGKNFFLRLLHYPPLSATPDSNQLRAGEHTDYGTVTLLFQQTGGLEIRTHEGDWLPAPAIDGTLLVNIGDALQRWTNHQFRSTPHRVALPLDANQSRYSMALFCDPDPDVEIACLPTCQIMDRTPDPPIRYRDYLQSRFDATY
jgi:isopenicillin N synthase-like dioxygenase